MFGVSPHDYYFGKKSDHFQYSLATNHSNISLDGSCSEVLSKNWSDRCYFVQNNDNCQEVAGFINYVSILYCTFGKSLLPLAIFVYILWLLVLFLAVAVSAEDYLCPSIEIISKFLRLSQNIAGVTIMALGNGAPDLATAIAGIGQDAPDLVFGELFGTGVLLTTVVAGAVCVIKPFKLMERPFLRDVIFYLVAGFWTFYIFWRQEIRLVDAIGFLALYLIYFVVVLVGRFINTRNRRDIPYTSQEDNEAENEQNQTSEAASDQTPISDTPLTIPEHNLSTSEQSNFELFLSALNPIEAWENSNLLWKVFQVIKSPVGFLFRLTIPVVDKEKPRDNWCQYLGILQCVLAPIFLVFSLNIALDRILNSNFQVWHLALLIGALLAVIVTFSSGSSAPIYHFMFAFAGFIMSIVWIFTIANELVSLLKAFGVMFGLSDAILGLTLLAWGNSIGDFMPDTTMAKRGSPRAGFSACFGGPLFNTLFGIGLPFTIQILQGGAPISLVCNKMTLVLSVGLGVSLCFSFIYMPIMQFQATKLYGIILIVMYIIFLVVCIAFEFTVMKHGDARCF